MGGPAGREAAACPLSFRVCCAQTPCHGASHPPPKPKATVTYLLRSPLHAPSHCSASTRGAATDVGHRISAAAEGVAERAAAAASAADEKAHEAQVRWADQGGIKKRCLKDRVHSPRCQLPCCMAVLWCCTALRTQCPQLLQGAQQGSSAGWLQHMKSGLAVKHSMVQEERTGGCMPLPSGSLRQPPVRAPVPSCVCWRTAPFVSRATVLLAVQLQSCCAPPHTHTALI